MEETTSKSGARIRLPEERWAHIVEEHDELSGLGDQVLETVRNPDFIVRGWVGALVAARLLEDGKALVVVYRELELDGFVITAFLTRKMEALKRRGIVWP